LPSPSRRAWNVQRSFPPAPTFSPLSRRCLISTTFNNVLSIVSESCQP